MKNLLSCTILALVISGTLSFGGSVYAQTLNDAIKLSNSEQFEKASEAFVSLIQREGTKGENYFYYGENLFKQEILDSSFKAIDLDSCRMMYEMGIKKNPSSPFCYIGLGKVYWYEGKDDDAKKQFYNAVQIISPANKTASFTKEQKANVYMSIAECYIHAPKKDITEALNLLNKAMKENDKSPDLYLLFGDATMEQSQGDASQAIGHYKKAYELDKTTCRALLRKGQLYNRARNLPEAVRTYDEAIAVNPDFAPAYREKAEAYYRGGQFETAIDNYKKYLALNSGSLSAKVRYASFLFLNKKYSEAVTEIQSIQKTNSEIVFLHRLLAYSAFETNQCDIADSAIERFFRLAPEKKVLSSDYEYYGKILSKCRKNDSLATEQLKLALKKDPSKVSLWSELGGSYLKDKKYPEAIEAYKNKMQDGKSNDANDYYNLGRAYYYSKDYVLADSAFVNITRMHPDLSTGYLWRARANAGLDPDSKKGQAKPHYELLISKIKPEDEQKNSRSLIEAHEYLGYYFMLQKDYNNAKCHFEKLKTMDPSNIKSKKALADPNLVKANCAE